MTIWWSSVLLYTMDAITGFNPCLDSAALFYSVSIPLLLSIPFLDSIAYLDSVAVFSSALMCCFVEYREVFKESVWWKLFKNVIRSNIKSRILADCFMACTRNSLKETNGICATRQADYSPWQHSSTLQKFLTKNSCGSTAILQTSPSGRLFPVPITESMFKIMPIWMSRRNTGKNFKGSNPDFFKILYGMLSKLAASLEWPH